MSAAIHAAKAAVLAATTHAKHDLYHKGANIGVLAAKAIEQSGEHGSVFELGEHIDVDLITWMVVGLIVFTILFEVSLNHLEKCLSHNEVYSECLGKVFKELTIMGFISFILLLIHEFVKIPFHEHIVFEFAHIWIFFVALVFIMHSIVFMFSLSMAEKKFKTWDTSPHHNTVMETPSIKDLLLGPDEANSTLNYHVAKEIFLHHNDLPKTFDFNMYIADFCGETICELLDTSEVTWCLLIVLFLLNLGRNHLVDYMNHTKEDPAKEMANAQQEDSRVAAAKAAAASLLALGEMTYNSKHLSFFQLTSEQVDAIFGTTQGHARSLWTFLSFGWCLLLVNFLALVWLRSITSKLLFEARFHIGRADGEEPDAHALELAEGHAGEEMMAKYLPCGKMKVFYYTLEFVVIVQCFYLGLLMLLNGRTAYQNFPSPWGVLFMLVMFLPPVINMLVVFPAEIKSIAFLSAITRMSEEIKEKVTVHQRHMVHDFQHKAAMWIKQEGKPAEQMTEELEKALANEEGVVTCGQLYEYFKETAGIEFKPEQWFTVFKQFDTEDTGLMTKEDVLRMLTSSVEHEEHETK